MGGCRGDSGKKKGWGPGGQAFSEITPGIDEMKEFSLSNEYHKKTQVDLIMWWLRITFISSEC